MNGLDGRYQAHRTLLKALFGPTGQPPAWRRDAACAEVGPDVFYDSTQFPMVRQLCAGCPVMTECRQDQLEWESQSSHLYKDPVGLVGGMSGKQRRDAHRPPGASRKEAA